MPTGDDFLGAIIVDPDADGPRLAYADWLEEGSDAERAEFIRVQCALAALPENERDFHPLREREKELLDAHRPTWVKPVYDLCKPPAPPGRWRRWLQGGKPDGPLYVEFRRGFIERLEVVAENYVRCADDIARRVPLRDLELWVGGTPALVDVLGFHHLSRLTALSLVISAAIGLSAGEMRQLVECRHLSGVRRLSLISSFDHTAMRPLVNSGLLPQLDALRVDFTGAGCADLATALLDSPATRGLREFGVNWSAQDPTVLQRLARTPPFTGLTEFGLFRVWIGDTDPREFLEWLPPTLTQLNLWAVGLGDLAAASLAHSLRLRQVRRVDLRHNRITDSGALALADSPHLLGPTKLNLTFNPISERVKNALRIRLGHQISI